MTLTSLFATSASGGGSMVMLLVVWVALIAVFWLLTIRPQKKKQKEHSTLLSTLEVGDSILTSSGFYGVVIDIMDEVVIVEFGSNKNCRIPMKKENIVEVEKSTAE